MMDIVYEHMQICSDASTQRTALLTGVTGLSLSSGNE